MASAGEFMRTGKTPDVCPNDSAWYLYIQACKSPKEFVQRVAQVESKGTDEDSDERKSTKRSLREIEKMLDAIGEENNGSEKIAEISPEDCEGTEGA